MWRYLLYFDCDHPKDDTKYFFKYEVFLCYSIRLGNSKTISFCNIFFHMLLNKKRSFETFNTSKVAVSLRPNGESIAVIPNMEDTVGKPLKR